MAFARKLGEPLKHALNIAFRMCRLKIPITIVLSSKIAFLTRKIKCFGYYMNLHSPHLQTMALGIRLCAGHRHSRHAATGLLICFFAFTFSDYRGLGKLNFFIAKPSSLLSNFAKNL